LEEDEEVFASSSGAVSGVTDTIGGLTDTVRGTTDKLLGGGEERER
jgi:hypothetical protein